VARGKNALAKRGKTRTKAKIVATRRNLVKAAQSQPNVKKARRAAQKRKVKNRTPDTPMQAFGRVMGEMMDTVMGKKD
jgi:hypothetical protein